MAGLSIPSIVDGSESPDLPGHGPLLKALWPKQQLAEKNASEVMIKPLNKTIEQVAERMMQLTNPIFGRLHRFPKYLRDLQRKVDADMDKEETAKPQETTQRPIAGYVKLLRVLIQHVCKESAFLSQAIS